MGLEDKGVVVELEARVMLPAINSGSVCSTLPVSCCKQANETNSSE